MNENTQKYVNKLIKHLMECENSKYYGSIEGQFNFQQGKVTNMNVMAKQSYKAESLEK